MNFKDYRYRETIRAAEVTEETIRAVPARFAETKGAANADYEPFGKGTYVENRNGFLIGWEKEEFESRFEPRRAERQAKTRKKREKVKAADA